MCSSRSLTVTRSTLKMLKAIGRMGGPTYVRTHDRFEMQRPKSNNEILCLMVHGPFGTRGNALASVGSPRS